MSVNLKREKAKLIEKLEQLELRPTDITCLNMLFDELKNGKTISTTV